MWGPILGRKLVWFPVFFLLCVYSFHPDFRFSPYFWPNWGPVLPVWCTLRKLLMWKILLHSECAENFEWKYAYCRTAVVSFNVLLLHSAAAPRDGVHWVLAPMKVLCVSPPIQKYKLRFLFSIPKSYSCTKTLFWLGFKNCSPEGSWGLGLEVKLGRVANS
jgi:hypothetical protein